MAAVQIKEVTTLPPLPRRLSMSEVCARYGFSRGGIYNGVERGSFPKPLKVVGRLRWREEDLLAFEAKQLDADEV
jgi:predicted DNA-binding transcriptional regulator AlpA